MTCATVAEVRELADLVGRNFSVDFDSNAAFSDAFKAELRQLSIKVLSIEVLEALNRTDSITLRLVETVDRSTEYGLQRVRQLLAGMTLTYKLYDRQENAVRTDTYYLWPYDVAWMKRRSDGSDTPFVWELCLKHKD